MTQKTSLFLLAFTCANTAQASETIGDNIPLNTPKIKARAVAKSYGAMNSLFENLTEREQLSMQTVSRFFYEIAAPRSTKNNIPLNTTKIKARAVAKNYGAMNSVLENLTKHEQLSMQAVSRFFYEIVTPRSAKLGGTKDVMTLKNEEVFQDIVKAITDNLGSKYIYISQLPKTFEFTSKFPYGFSSETINPISEALLSQGISYLIQYRNDKKLS